MTYRLSLRRCREAARGCYRTAMAAYLADQRYDVLAVRPLVACGTGRRSNRWAKCGFIETEKRFQFCFVRL